MHEVPHFIFPENILVEKACRDRGWCQYLKIKYRHERLKGPFRNKLD